MDLRKRVVAARMEDGQSMGMIAERFRIPKGTVQNILERFRETGSLAPKPQNAGRKPAFSGKRLRSASFSTSTGVRFGFRPRFASASAARPPSASFLRHLSRCEEYSPSRRNNAPI